MSAVLPPKYNPLLLFLAAVGFFGINVPFLFIAVFEREVYQAALQNPLALVFIAEAFLLMFFFAWLIARKGVSRPGWWAFIGLSLLGSLAFSVPLFLYLHNRKPAG